MDHTQPTKKSVYKSEKNRLDRLKAQSKYYYKNRDNILTRRKVKRGSGEPPASEKVKATTLVELYRNLKSYLESEQLI
jgi:phage portal protein BeeE